MKALPTLLLLPLLTVACRASDEERSLRSPDAGALPNVLAAKSADENAKDQVSAAVAEPIKSEPTAAPEDLPAQSPNQSPNQSPYQGDVDTDAPPLMIDDLSYDGSACPDGTVATNVSPDARAFTLLFSSFTMAIADDDKVRTTQNSCRLTLNLNVPPGWQYTLMSLDYRGFAQLENGATVAFDTAWLDNAAHSELVGPHADNFQIRDNITFEASNWSRCDGNSQSLTIDIKATLEAPSGSVAYLAVDSADGEMTQTYSVAWRACNP